MPATVRCRCSRACCYDVLRPSDACACYGGEEFVVILPSCALAEATIVADRIRTKLADATKKGPPFTVSIGLAEANPGDTLSEVIEHADAALLDAKALGRDRAGTFEAFATSLRRGDRACGGDLARRTPLVGAGYREPLGASSSSRSAVSVWRNAAKPMSPTSAARREETFASLRHRCCDGDDHVARVECPVWHGPDGGSAVIAPKRLGTGQVSENGTPRRE